MVPRTWLALLVAVGPASADERPIARLGSPALRHPDRPVCLAVAPDGSRIASGGTDGSLRVWDAVTGAEVHRLAVPDAVCTAVAFSPDGKLLAVHFADDRVRLLETKTFRQVRTVPTTPLDDVALNRDGSLVGGVGMTQKLALIEADTGLDRMELPNGRALAFVPDGSAVAAADAEQTVTVYEVPSGKPLATVRHPNRDGITSVAVSPDGARLVTADPGETGRVRVWDLKTAAKLGEWPGEGPVAFLTPEAIVYRRGGTVAVTKEMTGKPDRAFDAGAETFAVSADGRRLATAGVQRWVPGSDPVGLLTGRPGPVALAGGRLAAASGDGVGVWDVPAGGKELPALPDRVLERVTGPARAAAGAGSRLAVATEDRLTLVDAGSGRWQSTWPTPSPLLGVTLAPDGRRVTGVGRDGFVRSWATVAGRPVQTWTARIPRSLHAGIAAPADGRFVAVSTVIRLSLFDAATGAPIHSFERRWEDGPFRGVAVSPDGTLVAAGATGSGGAVTVWEVATRTVLKRITGGTGTVRHVAFLDGGRSVASVGSDENVIVWDLSGRPGNPAPTAGEAKQAWDRLIRDEAADGYPGVWVLAAAGADGVAAVRAGIAGAVRTQARVQRLIAQLDADAYPDRTAAAVALREMGADALPALVAAADRHPSPEVRQRAEKVVADLARAGVAVPPHGLVGEPLRQVRAVAALEAIGTPEAAAVLDDMAKVGGRPGDEARRAAGRMRK